LPANTRAIPPISAIAPKTGGSGMVFCFSAVASIGPISRTFSRLVYVIPCYAKDKIESTIKIIPTRTAGFIVHNLPLALTEKAKYPQQHDQAERHSEKP
jgi:hypothetical protein